MTTTSPKSNARELSLQILIEWEKHAGNLADRLSRQLDRTDLSPSDHHLCTELTYGTVRHLNSLDWAIARYCRYPLDKLTAPIRMILRQAAYQILHLDRIPDSAATNEAVKLARQYGHEGVVKLTNGVLRSLLRDRPQYPTDASPESFAIRHSLPLWLAERWITRYGDEAETLATAMNQPAPLHLRWNSLKGDMAMGLEVLRETDLNIEELALPGAIALERNRSTAALPGFGSGWWYVQDLGSQAIAHAIAPQPGQVIYDLCAAPGGKATHLAQMMGDRGQIVAVDDSPKRVKRLEENIQRLGITSIETRTGNAARIIFDQPADAILIDAPCSGFGVLRRKPDIRWARSLADLARLAEGQLKILNNAARWVKDGGVILYSTCTTEPEENEDVISAFLASHPDFTEVSLEGRLPSEWLTNQTGKSLRLLPHLHGTDGFFISLLQKQN